MKALYAGSFDPFTTGHLDIAKRALGIFGNLVIGVGFNEHKKGEFPVSERVAAIKKLFAGNPAVEVLSYKGLTAEFASEMGVGVLVRGVRNVADFEKERELADINLKVLGIPTIFIPADPDLSYVSSSMVRELLHNGFDASKYIPVDLKYSFSKQ